MLAVAVVSNGNDSTAYKRGIDIGDGTPFQRDLLTPNSFRERSFQCWGGFAVPICSDVASPAIDPLL